MPLDDDHKDEEQRGNDLAKKLFQQLEAGAKKAAAAVADEDPNALVFDADFDTLREMCNKTSVVNYVGMVSRPGVHLFGCYMEHKFYPPWKPELNKNFQLHVVKWPKEGPTMEWIIYTVPVVDYKFIEMSLRATNEFLEDPGVRIANGVPTMFSGDDIETFPVNGKNTFTIENHPDSKVHKGGSDVVDARERVVVGAILDEAEKQGE